MLSDSELVRAIAAGDRRALASLYDRHAAWLVLRLSQRCDDAGLVDETVQDTFVRAWRKAHTWRGEGQVGAWLWGIAIRRLVDGLRRRHPTPVGDVRPDRMTTVTAAEDEVLRNIEYGRLGPALDRLSPELRAVMQACVLDGLTAREAGHLLGLSPGTVKSRMHRARVRLREELA
jgi:RNA polymerase sigma-70 factor (ECF subfamily)